MGGPCESDTALCLAIAPGAAAGEGSPLRRVAGDVYLVDLDADPGDLPEQLTGLRVFAGYAGWSPGQLAGEIAEGAWACVPGHPDDVLGEASGPELWRSVMGRQTGRLARALDGSGRSDCQLRVSGPLRHLVGRTRERAVWGRDRPLPLSSA